MGEKNRELEEQKKQRQGKAGLFAALIIMLLLLLLALWFFFFRGKTTNEKVGGEGGFWSEFIGSRVNMDGTGNIESGKKVKASEKGDKDSSKSDKSAALSDSDDNGKRDKDTTSASSRDHEHKWVEVTEVVHHEAVYEDVWVETGQASTEQRLIRDAWDEDTGRCACGYDYNAPHDGSDEQYHYCCVNGDFGEEEKARHYPEVIHHPAEYETIEHPAEGHYENRLVQEAYDETVVTGQQCSVCGAKK